MLTAQFQSKLKSELFENPLKEGEFRRIEGLGKLYVSLSREVPVDSRFYFQYTLKIDDVDHHFFGENDD